MACCRVFLRCLIVGWICFQVPAFGATYYVHSVDGLDSNTGLSPSASWKTLDKVNSTTFSAGDRILFSAGFRWVGTLNPKGSGSAANPIVIDRYGEGDRPIIDGAGATGNGVVYLYNQQYWEIRNLEITNDPEEGGDRRGVMIAAGNFGVVHHVHLVDLYIHHIKGIIGQSIQAKDTGGIGIFIEEDDVKNTRFDDLLIEGCRIETIDNTGIFSRSRAGGSNTPGGSNWNRRRITNLRIRNNKINDIAKNAMIIRMADGGVVEYNVCWDTAYRTGTGNTIFSRSSRGTVFQYNEGYLNRSRDYDGCLYDADMESPGCIFQYSYSHDNNHGLFWMCTEPEDSNVIVRYNISQNDKGIIFCMNYANTSCYVYNNVVFVPPHLSPTIIDERRNADKTYYFFNNIIYNMSPTASYQWFNGKRHFSHNVFFGYHPDSEPDDPYKITDDPRFVNPGSGKFGIDSLDGYKLQPDSPCIDSGKAIANNGGMDYWRNRIPALGDIIDRGAHEFHKPKPGDIDSDGDADLKDLSILTEMWLFDSDGVPFKETDGRVVIEAEHYSSTTTGSNTASGSSWQVKKGQGSLNDSFMEVGSDSGVTVNDSLIESDSPLLSYLADFVTTGFYYVWIKAVGPSGGSDSLHYGLDGSAVSMGYDDSLEVDKLGSFSWRSSTKSVRPGLEVDSPGVHSIDLWMREDGVRIDRLLLTTDREYVPFDPEESISLRADLDRDQRVDMVDFAIYAQSRKGALN